AGVQFGGGEGALALRGFGTAGAAVGGQLVGVLHPAVAGARRLVVLPALLGDRLARALPRDLDAVGRAAPLLPPRRARLGPRRREPLVAVVGALAVGVARDGDGGALGAPPGAQGRRGLRDGLRRVAGDVRGVELEHLVGVERDGLGVAVARSEEHTSELQSRENLVCRLLLEKKNESSH